MTSIDPALVTAAGPTTLTITGTMTNSGPEALTNLSYRFQRGQALGTDADVRQELAAAQRADRPGPGHLHPDRPRTWPAGASAPFVFTAAITDTDGLDVDAPGVYPLMVNVNGAVTWRPARWRPGSANCTCCSP